MSADTWQLGRQPRYEIHLSYFSPTNSYRWGASVQGSLGRDIQIGPTCHISCSHQLSYGQGAPAQGNSGEGRHCIAGGEEAMPARSWEETRRSDWVNGMGGDAEEDFLLLREKNGNNRRMRGRRWPLGIRAWMPHLRTLIFFRVKQWPYWTGVFAFFSRI